ncbi:MAG: hypothetical protein FJ279_14675 [Planctomycetes bacterium]|nr:hypothetical protein [Planctomycetota bacterium]
MPPRIPLVGVLALAVAAVTAAEAPVAVNKNFAIEDCGTPTRVSRLLASTLYKHPDTGRLHLFLEYGSNNGYGIGEQEWEDTGHRLIDVELESGTMRRAVGAKPAGLSTMHFLHPNGKMYLFEVKTSPASLAEYDTRTGEYRRLGRTGDSAYKVVLTPSHRIYIGEVNGGVAVYDPATRKLSHYDRPAGRPIHWGVYTMEVEEPWIYCGMTNHGKWFLTILDTRTDQAVSYFDVESGQPAAKGGGQSVMRTEAGNLLFGPYLLKDGKPQMDADGNPRKLDPPDKSKPLPGNRPWPNMWRVSGYAGSESNEPKDGLGIEFDLTDAEPDNWNGGLATIRWRRKDETDWRKIEIQGIDLVGSSPKSLAVAPDGKMIGVAQHYGAVFRFDPATGKSDRIGDAPGSVYEILALEDRTYFCGYVSFLAEYDHRKPYTITGGNRADAFTADINPKLYRTETKWTRCMAMGPDGRIYLGGQDGRHRTGGGLSIFDPQTKAMELIRKPFEFLGVVGLYFINGGKTLALTTKPVGQGGPDRGSIFLYDVAQRKIAREVKLDIQANPDQLFIAGDDAVIGVSRAEETDEYGRKTHYTLVYGLDLESGKLRFEKRHPGRAFTGMCAYDHTSLVRGPDGCGWLFVDDSLCRIHPDGTLEKVRDRMDYRGHIVWQDKTMYIYNGGRVYNRLFSNVVRIPNLFAR